MVEKAFHRLAIPKMRGDNFWSILGLDMGIKNAFRFNDYIGTLLAETVTTSEIHLGMAYPLPAYFFLKRIIDSFRAAGKASCPMTNKYGAVAFHITCHPLDA
jgi:hypothetical protein